MDDDTPTISSVGHSLEPEASAAVALRVSDLPLSDAVTVVFHGRRDLGTIQTYVARGRHGTGAALSRRRAAARAVRPRPRRRRATATRPSACTPSRRSRCATRWRRADTVLDDLARAAARTSPTRTWTSTRASTLDVELPAHRAAADGAGRRRTARCVVAPVCEARTLAEGRPPLGIACLQQDVARVYPLPDDPEALPGGLPRAAPPSTRTAWRTRSTARRRPSRGSSRSRTSTRPPRPALTLAACSGGRRSRRSSSGRSCSSASRCCSPARWSARAASARRSLDILRGAGARATPTRCSPRCRRCARDATCARVTAERTERARARRRGRDPQLRRRPRRRRSRTSRARRASPGARRSGVPGRPVRRRPARGAADRRRREIVSISNPIGLEARCGA